MRNAFGGVVAAIGIPVVLSAVWLGRAPERELAAREARWGAQIEPGDLVFQDLSCGERCELIRAVTRSRYVHVGLVLEASWMGAREVWEALGPPVGSVPLTDFVKRGRGARLAVYRPAPFIRARLAAVAREVRAMRGRPYDPDYQWDEGRIYCSELIARAVNAALERPVFAPRPVGSDALGPFAGRAAALSHGRITAETLAVSPADLAHSPHVTRVIDEL